MEFEFIDTIEKLKRYVKQIVPADIVAFDTELTGLRINATLLMISMCKKGLKPCSIVVDSPYFDGIPLEEIRNVLNPIMPTVKGVAHNAKFDVLVFERRGLVAPPIYRDTALMCHVYNPDNRKQLETRVKEDLKVDKKTYKEIIKKNWDKIDWFKDVEKGVVKIEELAEYAAADAYYTLELLDYYEPLLEKEGLMDIHNKIEIPFSMVLKDMKDRGILINKQVISEIDEQLIKGIKDVTKEIYALAGCDFNLNSPKQKADVLFNRLKLPTFGKTKTGADSTDADTLEKLADAGYEIGTKMLEYSELQKLQSGYSSSIPDLIDLDGRLRCDFNADGTRTGRLSSSNPNLQNQPNNPKYPIRKSFIATEGYKLMIADYSQIEPRIMAHMSKDQKMIDIYKSAGDIYIGIATELGITRKEAKVVQLAISYGLGPDKLANSLGISVQAAKDIIKLYYQKYNTFGKWKESVENYAARQGYVKNMFGRIRRLPNAKMPHLKGLYFQALRQAVNTVIQGSAADFLKVSMIQIHERWKDKDSHIMLQVHDELVCEAKIPIVTECFKEMCHLMENTIPLSVPIKAEGKICDNWSQMKDDAFHGTDMSSFKLSKEELDLITLLNIL